MSGRIVIAGGGFGGLYCALYLSASPDRPRDARIILLDRKNFFTFTPLLTEVASGSLGREHVTQPYRIFARRHDFEFVQASIQGFDLYAEELITDQGRVGYDYLVIASGNRPRYFGDEELERKTMPFQTLRDALALRNRTVGLIERLGHTDRAARRRRMMTFVVVGAGPAGTEVASELRHLLCEIAPLYYDIDVTPRIVLVEAGDEILGQFDGKLAADGHRILEARGVEVRTGVRVDGFKDGVLQLSDGQSIDADTVVWTAGMGPSRMIRESELPLENGGVAVDEYLRVQGRENVYAVGDCSFIINERTGEPYPNVAPIAINQGMRAAANIENSLMDRPLEPYQAHYAGKIVSLGAGQALVETLGFRWTGRPAWWMYRLVYLLKLVGTKPKIRVALTLALNKLFSPDLSYEREAGEPLPGAGEGS